MLRDLMLGEDGAIKCAAVRKQTDIATHGIH